MLNRQGFLAAHNLYSFASMHLNIQPTLEAGGIVLYPLQEADFEDLYNTASNPKIWEQHPNKDRWKKEVFKVFFEGALQSNGAFKIVDKATEKIIGSTRYYGFSEQDRSIYIGYTFYATEYWGKGINHRIKAVMLDYIFDFVNTVRFQIGAHNIRSQISIVRLRAEKIGEEETAYYGEEPKLNFVYEMRKETWEDRGLE